MPTGIFVLPVVGAGTSSDPRRPKYITVEGGDLADGVEAYHGSEEMEKGGTDYMAVSVRITTQGDYDTLAEQSDAYEIDGQVMADALNSTGTFPVDLTPKEWGLVLSRVLAAINM